MCYAKPGPRCSGHTRDEMNNAKAVFDADPTPENESAYKAKKKEYLKTPEGIKILRTKGKNEAADRFEAERKEAIANYNALKDEKDQKEREEREWQSNFARKLENERLDREEREKERKELLKKLPKDWVLWDFDENGYADWRDLDFQDALSSVHTGAGEDYLAANNLTELYGWTTEDVDGDREPFIYTRSDVPGDPDITDQTEWEVRSVTLYNTSKGREGETRKVYRLDDGNNGGSGYVDYSTFGSYEEAVASMRDSHPFLSVVE